MRPNKITAFHEAKILWQEKSSLHPVKRSFESADLSCLAAKFTEANLHRRLLDSSPLSGASVFINGSLLFPSCLIAGFKGEYNLN
jgi:hypothetical protein